MLDIEVVAFAMLPVLSTSVGGYAAVRMRKHLHPLMAFAGGVLVGAALLDLLPEAEALAAPALGTMAPGVAAAAGFLLLSSVEAFIHRQTWEHRRASGDAEHEGEMVGLGLAIPAGLVVHSLLDGLAIGLSFHAGPQVGVVVALAVLGHDFADGMNVVTLVFDIGGGRPSAIAFLALDAAAPLVGAVAGSLMAIPGTVLGMLLGGFAGAFIAIGPGHLLPEAQHDNPGRAPSFMLLTAAGAALVLAVRSLAP